MWSFVVSALLLFWDAMKLQLLGGPELCVIGLLSMWIYMRSIGHLLNETSGSQDLCLFLRAFRSDASSDQLRAWLTAALGIRFKLAGIRPPAERVSRWFSYVSPLLVGLRYIGSRQFELEAGEHNWLARLLATFSRARFVFVDVRDITPHVMDEITLSWRVFGEDRTVFIVDDALSESEWLLRIGGYLNASNDTQTSAPLKLLVWPVGKSPAAALFTEKVQSIVGTIPEGIAGVPEEALQLARERISTSEWKTHFSEHNITFIILGIAVVVLLHQGLSNLPPGLALICSPLPIIVIQCMFWAAWVRVKRQRSFAVEVNPLGPPAASRIWLSGLGMLSPIITGAAIFFIVRSQVFEDLFF